MRAGLRAGIDTARYEFRPRGREPLTMLFVGSFRHDPNRAAPGGIHGLSRFLHQGSGPGGAHDSRAFLAQHLACHAPDPFAGAGDNRDSSTHPSHNATKSKRSERPSSPTVPSIREDHRR